MERNGHHPALLSLSNIKDLIPLVLDFENVPYNCWSTLFCVIARAYNVLHHIDATIPTPTVERDDPLLWAQLDAVVLSWIYATISSDLLVAILGENLTAIQTWTCLYNIFQHNNLSMTPKKRKLNINLNEEANESEIEGESVIMDSISCLPDDVLVYLLSFVGMKTAGKTSLLSKRDHYASRGFPNFVRVEQLEIISAPFNVNLLSLIPLIEACPLLHTFKLKFQSMEQVQWSSNEPTTAHINAIRSHQHLKTVEYVGYGGCGSSAKLALCLTNYAPMLDKFIFNPHPFKYVEYRYDVYSREYMDKMAAARCYAQGLAYKMRKSLDVVIL